MEKIIFQLNDGFKRLFRLFSIFFLFCGIALIFITLQGFIHPEYSPPPVTNIYNGLLMFLLISLQLYFVNKLYNLTKYIYILDNDSIIFCSKTNKKKYIKLDWKEIQGIKTYKKKSFFFRSTHEWLIAKKVLYASEKKMIPIYLTEDMEKFNQFILERLGPNYKEYSI